MGASRRGFGGESATGCASFSRRGRCGGAQLQPDAAKFNARASTVFTKIDGVTKMFDEYAASMKP
jgi:hypothetical protein